MVKKSQVFFLIICIVGFLTACARLTTTYSTLKIEANEVEVEKVQEIVHNTFVGLGFQYGVKKKSYWKWKEKSDIPIQYPFIVTYRVIPDLVIVRIENHELGPTTDKMKAINHYLSEATELMNKRFADANLKVTATSQNE